MRINARALHAFAVGREGLCFPDQSSSCSSSSSCSNGPATLGAILAHPVLVRIKALGQFREHGHNLNQHFFACPLASLPPPVVFRQYSTVPRDSALAHELTVLFCAPFFPPFRARGRRRARGRNFGCGFAAL